MTLNAFALIILAGLIHACWNIAAKKAGGDSRFAFFTSVLMMFFWAPLGWWLGRDAVPLWGAVEWGFVVASGVLHVVYYVILLRGYRKADLTVVYPVARGSGPLLSSVGAVVVLGTLIGITARPIPALSLGSLAVEGVFDLPVIPGGTAVPGATSGPEKAMRSGRLARCGCTTSLARNSSGADAAARRDG